MCVGLANGDSFVELLRKLLNSLGIIFFQRIPSFKIVVVGTPSPPHFD